MSTMKHGHRMVKISQSCLQPFLRLAA